MKYVVFTVAALGVPPLAFLLYINRQWQKYAFWAMVAALILYNGTSINFFSCESYRGTSRGMEVSVIHLFAFALLAALKLQGRVRKFFPEPGFLLYAIYFLLCLPSLTAVDDGMIAWFEVWKMMLLYVFYLTVYSYLKATDDVCSVLKGLAVYAVVNMLFVVKDRFTGVYQAHGAFPHQNSMAMAMQLLGALFFAGYLMYGIFNRYGRICAAAFTCAALATFRSFSRGAIALIPVAYGVAALASLARGRTRRVFRRLLPIIIIGMIGLAVLLPRIIERYVNAPKQSGDTRIEFAYCAWEMIKDEPLRGIGINNWSIKMKPPYEYRDQASRILDKELTDDGIVETVYLLVAAECGIPAFLAMLAWFAWHWFSCLKLTAKLKGTRYFFVPAGLLGGLTAIYMQSALEWVLRQQVNLFLLVFLFAITAYLNTSWRELKAKELEVAHGK